jgi:hypothetical protein
MKSSSLELFEEVSVPEVRHGLTGVYFTYHTLDVHDLTVPRCEETIHYPLMVLTFLCPNQRRRKYLRGRKSKNS